MARETAGVKFNLLRSNSIRPSKSYDNDAGFDLSYNGTQPITLSSGMSYTFMTGISVSLPEGTVGLVCPRSGLAKEGITVLNSPGIIDSGFEGEIGIELINHGQNRVTISTGDRIAQIVIVPLYSPVPVSGSNSKVIRGQRGFGSSGR